MFPAWFHILSIAFLLLGGLCALVILVDVARDPQHMGVMNVVWPVTALFGSLAVLWAYFSYGKMSSHSQMQSGNDKNKKKPFPIMVGSGALHCGSGCMIGDIIAEWLAFLAPTVAVWFGWHWLFAEKTFAVWVLDFIFAFFLGIVFQYFAIVPMRGLSPAEGLKAAVKADTLSLISWQVGMYGAMAILQFAVFPAAFGQKAEVDTPEFWFAMQIAMIAGFCTAFPVNWWLITAGIKEKM